jgi:hypothetical protein
MYGSASMRTSAFWEPVILEGIGGGVGGREIRGGPF